jgi:hypothetical protein
MVRYSCALNGLCESDPLGAYDSLEECQDECASSENRDLMYLILAYVTDDVRLLAPSDRVRVVRELTGETLTPGQAYKLLLALEKGDVFELIKHPQLHPYILELTNGDEAMLEALSLPNLYPWRFETFTVEVEVEETESDRIQTLVQYPALYPQLATRYMNEYFEDEFIQALTLVPTVEALRFFQSLDDDPVELQSGYASFLTVATDDELVNHLRGLLRD